MTCVTKLDRINYTFLCPRCGETHEMSAWQGVEIKFGDSDLFDLEHDKPHYVYRPPTIEYVTTRWPLPCAQTILRVVVWLDNDGVRWSMVLRYLSCDTRERGQR